MELKEEKFRWEIRKEFFPVKVRGDRDGIPREVGAATSLECPRLGTIWDSEVSFTVSSNPNGKQTPWKIQRILSVYFIPILLFLLGSAWWNDGYL